ncbi:MAG: DUF3644 domain-containing protein [Pseudomonadota bacterium]|nr:DUF3644 domain-containing protein [Pseudomonadota bacterium]
MLDKSLQAALSAIELYNKPNFSYREESFSILMVNAWELLLKAKKIKDNNGRVNALYIGEYKKKRNGEKSKKLTYKTNRTGNYHTVSIFDLLSALDIDSNLKVQIETLIEIRDSAVHYMNSTKLFEKEFLGVATASLKSYEITLQDWFNKSISDYDLSLIPLSFNAPDVFNIETLKNAPQAHKTLLEYILKQRSKGVMGSEHSISLIVEVKYKKNADASNSYSFSKDGTPIFYDSEDEFKNKYPWDWSTLREKIKNRYSDLLINKEFWAVKGGLESDDKLVGEWYPDPTKRTGTPKKFYSTNILKEFDKHYTKKV